MAAVDGNAQKFGCADGVGFQRREFLGFVCIAVGIADDAARRQQHRLVKVPFFLILRVCDIQRGNVLLGLPYDAAEAFFEQHILIVRRDLAHGLPPLGVTINDAGVHTDMPGLGGQTRQECFFQRFSFPVGEDLFTRKTALFVRHDIGVLRAGGKMVHLAVDPLPGEFRCQDAAFAEFADGPYDQLPLKNMHTQPGAAIVKCLRTADTGGLSLALFVRLRPECSALAGNLRLCVYIILSYFFDSCGKHVSFPPFSHCWFEDTVTRPFCPRQWALEFGIKYKRLLRCLCFLPKTRKFISLADAPVYRKTGSGFLHFSHQIFSFFSASCGTIAA